MWVDPASDLLSHLAGLTGLTRLCWDTTFLTPDLHEGEMMAAAMAGLPMPDVPDTAAYKDGGLSALGASLPSSLVRLELREFVPETRVGDGVGGLDGGGSDSEGDSDDPFPLPLEADVLMGSRHLAASGIALPALESREVEADASMLSPEGRELAGQIMAYMREMREGEDEAQDADFDIAWAFREAYPAFFIERGWQSGLTPSESEEEGGEEEEEGEEGEQGASDSEGEEGQEAGSAEEEAGIPEECQGGLSRGSTKACGRCVCTGQTKLFWPLGG